MATRGEKPGFHHFLNFFFLDFLVEESSARPPGFDAFISFLKKKTARPKPRRHSLFAFRRLFGFDFGGGLVLHGKPLSPSAGPFAIAIGFPGEDAKADDGKKRSGEEED